VVNFIQVRLRNGATLILAEWRVVLNLARTSMQRIADLLSKEQVKLWINHDKVQVDTLRHASEFYD
jgi:hypothetical protein